MFTKNIQNLKKKDSEQTVIGGTSVATPDMKWLLHICTQSTCDCLHTIYTRLTQLKTNNKE